MKKFRTVILLGAGAQMPYGFPSGPKLTQDIIVNLRGGRVFDDEHTRVRKDPSQEHLDLAARLEKSAISNIDAYIFRNPNHARLLKTVIVEIIKQYEKHLLKEEGPAKPRDIADDWLAYFWNRLLGTFRSKDGLTGLQITFISLNYDGFLEYSLPRLIQNTFSTIAPAPMQLLANAGFEILHANGSWAEFKSGLALEKNIRTPEEMEDSEAALIASRKRLEEAGQILFLGFGYHLDVLNKLGLLADSKTQAKPKSKIRATAFGIGEGEVEAFRQNKNPSVNLDVIPGNCGALLASQQIMWI